MSSSFIQIKPIGSHPMGMRPWHNPLTLSSSPDFPQARRRVASNLFGSPERGAINEIYRQEEKQRNQHFHQRYSFDLEELPTTKLQQQPTSKPTIITRPTAAAAASITTTTISNATKNITAESRLSGGESLIEKELREHEMKLKQQRKKTVNCNEKLVVLAAGDRIKSRSLKLEEHNAAAAAVARTFVDSSKCASGGHGERPKPYARLQSSMTDYYAQRKTVVCNNNRTASEVSSVVVEEATIGVLPHLSDEIVEVESPPTTKTTNIRNSVADSNSESLSSSSCSSSSSASSSSQEQTLHTLTTDVSAELA